MGQPQSTPGPPGTKFRVIGAGMSRTGTKTLNEALNILIGGPIHDSGVQCTGGSSKQIKEWMEVMDLAPRVRSFSDRKRLEYLLASLFDGYTATMDCPACLLVPELMDVFPDAVVIATTRDPKSWWRSMQYVEKMTANWYLPLVVMWIPRIGMYAWSREKFRSLALWRYNQDCFGPDILVKHEEHLREVVPPEKLFWYEVKEGWEPLCKILNMPVPDVPFPHNNSQDEALKAYRDLMLVGFCWWGLVLGMGGATWWMLKQYRWF